MTTRDSSDSFWQVMASLAESVDGASEDELQDALGVTPDGMGELAEETRSLLSGAVSAFRKRQLASARRDYERSVTAYQTSPKRGVAGATEKMRRILGEVLNTNPDLRPALTAQFRDFETMSDKDVEGAFRQLVALGVIEYESDSLDPSDEDQR